MAQRFRQTLRELRTAFRAAIGRRFMLTRGLVPACGVALAFGLMLLCAQEVQAHGHQPPWLDETTLDEGLFVAVQHPRVIRASGPIDVKVIVRNIAGARDVTIGAVRYLTPDDRGAELHRVGQLLPTSRAAFQQYRQQREKMHDLLHHGDRAGAEQLSLSTQSLLQELTAHVCVERYRAPAEIVPDEVGARFRLTVEIDVIKDGKTRAITRDVEIPIEAPLPNGTETTRPWRYDLRTSAWLPGTAPGTLRGATEPAVWYAGDQHLHTTYSLDAVVLQGTEEDVTDYATTAELMGLDWIIVTDHSNVHVTWGGTEYYTPEQFAAGTAQAAAYTAGHDFTALYGEEMGAGSSGFFNLPAHYLAYPYASDSTGYLANPSSGMVFGLANCEPEQVIIDRVNNAGGFGFIAHPFDSGTAAFVEWDFDNGATGWAGLEIWSDTNGEIKGTDDEAFAKWHDLLNDIAAPQQGQLADRPDFPNTFPAGLGNSDAHEPGLIAATFSYAWMTDVARPQVVQALMRGRCVASNGPLVFGELNGARIGEVAFALAGDNDLSVTLMTTSEFGPVGDYEITVFVNGSVRTVLPPNGDPGFALTVDLTDLNLTPPDKFVTLRADSTNGTHHALANPIWLQFTGAGDTNADGLINLSDYLPFAECMTGPKVVRVPACDTLDFDRDVDVDLADFVAFQEVFTAE